MRLNVLLDQIPLLPRNIAHSDEQHEAIVIAILPTYLRHRNDARYRSLAPGIADFQDTAAILAELDLLVSVDTSTAHLAGALARSGRSPACPPGE